jgi:superkiller protein 3
VTYYLDWRELETVVAIAESGISLAEKLEGNIGRRLDKYVFVFLGILQLGYFAYNFARTTQYLNVHLATALVHLNPPKHHQRARRILDAVLAKSPDNVDCLMGKGYVLEHAGRWQEAADSFERALKQDSLPESKRIEAREERAWSLVKARRLEEGEDELRKVILLREEEGEETEDVDDDAIARIWWRLGKCLWYKGGKSLWLDGASAGT